MVQIMLCLTRSVSRGGSFPAGIVQTVGSVRLVIAAPVDLTVHRFTESLIGGLDSMRALVLVWLLLGQEPAVSNSLWLMTLSSSPWARCRSCLMSTSE